MRRLSISLLVIVSLVSVVSVAGHAQSLPPLTHHVREVTLNGQAQIGRTSSRGRSPCASSSFCRSATRRR